MEMIGAESAVEQMRSDGPRGPFWAGVVSLCQCGRPVAKIVCFNSVGGESDGRLVNAVRYDAFFDECVLQCALFFYASDPRVGTCKQCRGLHCCGKGFFAKNACTHSVACFENLFEGERNAGTPKAAIPRRRAAE